MRTQRTGRPSPALVVALIALVAALAGTAAALPGRNGVDKNDIQKNAVRSKHIKKNAVRSKHIKNGQVKAADLRANSVRSAKIADGSVAAADLVPNEPFHNVGDPGEPAFGDGDDGDCTWTNMGELAPGVRVNPVSFALDRDGIVRLAGLASSDNAGDGDGQCDELTDFRVFTLPPAYRPENVELHALSTDPNTGVSYLALIVGDEDVDAGGETLVSGGVYIQGSSPADVTLDGVTFRAAGPGDNGLAPTRGSRAKLPAEVLERFGIEVK